MEINPEPPYEVQVTVVEFTGEKTLALDKEDNRVDLDQIRDAVKDQINIDDIDVGTDVATATVSEDLTNNHLTPVDIEITY
jgi:hypothetical protein